MSTLAAPRPPADRDSDAESTARRTRRTALLVLAVVVGAWWLVGIGAATTGGGSAGTVVGSQSPGGFETAPSPVDLSVTIVDRPADGLGPGSADPAPTDTAADGGSLVESWASASGSFVVVPALVGMVGFGLWFALRWYRRWQSPVVVKLE